MTNIMRVGTKTLEVWREEELQSDCDLGIPISDSRSALRGGFTYHLK